MLLSSIAIESHVVGERIHMSRAPASPKRTGRPFMSRNKSFRPSSEVQYVFDTNLYSLSFSRSSIRQFSLETHRFTNLDKFLGTKRRCISLYASPSYPYQCSAPRKGCLQPLFRTAYHAHPYGNNIVRREGINFVMVIFHEIARKLFNPFQLNLWIIVLKWTSRVQSTLHFASKRGFPLISS